MISKEFSESECIHKVDSGYIDVKTGELHARCIDCHKPASQIDLKCLICNKSAPFFPTKGKKYEGYMLARISNFPMIPLCKKCFKKQ